MKAIEFIEKIVKEEFQNKVNVLGIGSKGDNFYVYHIHRNEEIPKDDRPVITLLKEEGTMEEGYKESNKENVEVAKEMEPHLVEIKE